MEKLIGDNTIVFFADPSRDCAPQEKDWVTKATDFIQKHQRRLILESQLGLAILHVSLERFCNPLTTSQWSSQASITHLPSQSLPPPPLEQPHNLLDNLRELDVADSRSNLHTCTEQHHERRHALETKTISEYYTRRDGVESNQVPTRSCPKITVPPVIFTGPILPARTKAATATNHSSKLEEVIVNRQADNSGQLHETKSRHDDNRPAIKSPVIESLSLTSPGEPIKYPKESAVVLHDQPPSTFRCEVYRDSDLPSNVTKTEFRDLSCVVAEKDISDRSNSEGHNYSDVVNFKRFKKVLCKDGNLCQSACVSQLVVHVNKKNNDWSNDTDLFLDDEDGTEQHEEEENWFQWEKPSKKRKT